MSTKVKFAIVGCGRIAQRHAEHIHAKGELVAVCDCEIEKVDLLASQYEAKAYYDIDELLAHEKELDVVAVCSPNGLHAIHSIKALNAGFHVLCEKPMAITSYDCGRMIQAAERSNRRLFAIKQNRYNPPVAAVKKVLDEGRLGKIMSVQLSCFWNRNPDYYKNSWKGTLELDGGTLFTQFSHFVDLLYWLVGDVKEVQAYVGNFDHQGIIEFEDTGVVILEFANGAIGTINYSVNSYQKNMEGSLTLFGTKGTVKIGGQYLNELEYQNIEGYKIDNLPEGNKPNNYGNYVGSMSNHDKVYDNVIEVLQHNASITTSSFEGMKTVEIIESIYKKPEKLIDMRKVTSYSKVQGLIGKIIRGHRLGIRNKNSKLLNVGCGPHANKDFINLDYWWTPEIDICWDIVKKKYPIESNLLEGIYTEHCLEHIPHESFIENCREFFRMLKSGGTLRIIMPDGEIYLDIYQDRKNGGTQKMPYEEGYITPMARINGIFRNHGHLFIYDFATVKKILADAGFVDIKKQTFRNGRSEALLIDTDWRAHESLYVEASKP